MSANPNNCAACDYKQMNDDATLHCYMLKNEPQDICMQHTKRTENISQFGSAVMQALIFAKLMSGLHEDGAPLHSDTAQQKGEAS